MEDWFVLCVVGSSSRFAVMNRKCWFHIAWFCVWVSEAFPVLNVMAFVDFCMLSGLHWALFPKVIYLRMSIHVCRVSD